MNITIKTLTGKSLKYVCQPNDKILDIKHFIEEKDGITPEQQRLVFGGKQLDDSLLVSESRIKDGSLIHLVLALRGGTFFKK